MKKNKYANYDKERLEKLISEKWTIIGKIPKNKVTKSMCKSAILQNCNALNYIPPRYLTEEIYMLALQKDYHAIKSIPKNKLTKKYCQTAFDKDIVALKYIPKRFKTDEMCIKAMNNNWTLFEFCNDNMFNIENVEKILNMVIKTENISNMSYQKQVSLYNILERIKENNLYNKNIKNSINVLKNYNIIKKKYDAEMNKFIVVRNWFDIKEKEVIEIETFDEFYNYLNGDLSNADIYDYDFKNVDLKKYNIKDANIKSDILVKQGLYDDTYYNENIKKIYNMKTLVPLEKEQEKSIAMLHDDEIANNGFIGNSLKYACIYYISDIHLDYKIFNRFKEHATKLEIEMYIKEFVKKMLSYANGFYRYLIIAGDVANSYEISKMFYQELINQNKFINPENIVVILGNHELWNSDCKVENNVNCLIDLYRGLFKELGITFLQNELALFKPDLEIISKENLMKMDDLEIQNMCVYSKVTILGGIGFSGFNPRFNANNLIYGQTLTNIDEDRKLTNEFLEMYMKLKKVIPDKGIIILTHTPKQDWSNDEFNSNWVYINGHTHINTYSKDDKKILYADNQLGYFNEDVCLKKIDFSIKCNMFQYYEDGIYEIDADTYKKFYFKMGHRIECNIQEGTIYLLKRYKTYLFLYKNVKDTIYILNGGAKNKLENQNINYYYNNMNKYANLIKTSLKSYYSYIKKVSDYVKSFGGSGNIHGAIVDIDYYNHLYVNVYDGKITPYFALSIVDKYIYKDLRKMLKENCHNLLKRYDDIVKNTKGELIPIRNDLINTGAIYYEDTGIYRESLILKKIQYLIDDNIIRIWKDDILNSNNMDILMIDNEKSGKIK